MEDFKNCHYDPESDNPPKPRQGWWWLLALIGVLGVLVVWIKWPDTADTASAKATERDHARAELNQEFGVAKKNGAVAEAEGAGGDGPENAVKTQAGTSRAPVESESVEVRSTMPAEPEYEFYTLLQKQEVVIPEEELEKHRPEAPTLKPGVYVLQVGSFRTQSQAARSRTRLAKHGLEASIQQVTTKDDKVWFRVRIGPYIDPDELRATREILIDLKIDSIPIRLR